MKLAIKYLRSGKLVRPQGQLGSCGWAPKAWTAVPVYSGEEPITEFLRVNKNWKLSDISGLTHD